MDLLKKCSQVSLSKATQSLCVETIILAFELILGLLDDPRRHITKILKIFLISPLPQPQCPAQRVFLH